jgi:hypothetical protein
MLNGNYLEGDSDEGIKFGQDHNTPVNLTMSIISCGLSK